MATTIHLISSINVNIEVDTNTTNKILGVTINDYETNNEVILSVSMIKQIVEAVKASLVEGNTI